MFLRGPSLQQDATTRPEWDLGWKQTQRRLARAAASFSKACPTPDPNQSSCAQSILRMCTTGKDSYQSSITRQPKSHMSLQKEARMEVKGLHLPHICTLPDKSLTFLNTSFQPYLPLHQIFLLAHVCCCNRRNQLCLLSTFLSLKMLKYTFLKVYYKHVHNKLHKRFSHTEDIFKTYAK